MTTWDGPRCPERRYGGYNRATCGNPLRTPEMVSAKLCGVHLLAVRRKAERDARWEAQRKAQRATERRRELVMQRLRDATGLQLLDLSLSNLELLAHWCEWYKAASIRPLP